MSLKFVPMYSVDDDLPLVHIMARHQTSNITWTNVYQDLRHHTGSQYKNIMWTYIGYLDLPLLNLTKFGITGTPQNGFIQMQNVDDNNR